MSDTASGPLSILLLTLVFIMAVAVTWRIIPDGPGVPWQLNPAPELQSIIKTAYYALLCLLLAFYSAIHFKRRKKTRITIRPVSFLCVILLITGAISLLTNNVARIFHSWPRLLAIALVMVLSGPIIFSRTFHTLRQNLLRFICMGCIAISLLYAIALVFYLTHYTSYLSRYQFVWDWLNVASVPCGTAAALGALLAWTRLCGQSSARIRRVWRAAFILCWWTMIMASSRAAIAGLTVALTALLFIAPMRCKDFMPTRLRWITIAMIAFMAVAVFRPLTEIMETKYWKITDTPDDNFFSSRKDIWDARSHEAESHLLFGIGFASVESNPGVLNPDASVPADGRIEPGSGWLYLLSSCGIFALTAFAAIYFWSLSGAVRKLLTHHEDTPVDLLLVLGMTLFFGVHLFSEGYMMASGSPFCIMLWLTMGLANTPTSKPATP